MVVLLQLPEQHWVCGNCTATDASRGQANRFHQCAGLAGILAPMVLDGFRGRVLAVERQDYIGREMVQYDGNGRPVMAVVTEHGDGSNDVIVNAPTAQGAGGR
jgi:hypothetical protein